MGQEGNFMAALFDLSFTDFITTRLIRVLYVVNMVVAGLFGLVLIVGGFGQSAGIGLLMLLVIGPLAFIVVIMLGRVCLELMIVVFRIADHTAQMARQAGPAQSIPR